MTLPTATNTATCQRCGAATSPFSPLLTSIARLQRTPRPDHAATLAALESVPPDVAAEWLHHHYHQSCERALARCPDCNGELRTWQARWCPHCKHRWA